MRRNKHRLARTLAAAVSPLSGRHANASRRVLMFHAVDDVGVDADHDLYNHSRTVFVAQIDALQQWAEGHRLPFVAFDGRDEAGLCLTFDDGYASIVSVVAPLLIERHIPFHVFVPVGLVSDRRGTHLSRHDITSLATEPLVGFGAHGLTHRPLDALRDDDLAHELTESRRELSGLAKRDIVTMSYPFGRHDERVRSAVRESGFQLAATSSPGRYSASRDALQIPRTDVWAMDSPRDAVQKARGAWDWLL